MHDTIGPYRIESEVGRGGMGIVYRATDTRLDRVVAIKALPEELASDPPRLERFEREAKTLASLSHPNVAGIHGVEEHEGRRYLILEFVEGETLADVLDRGALSVDDALEVCDQIAAGLESAHESGIIHRDLKPANVKITPERRVKVLDFGLAKTVAEASESRIGVSETPTLTSPVMNSPTIPGAILGTAPYMSPEQARGRPVDKRSDIWSFGVLLYECLTGVGPFHGETATDSIGAILHKDVDLGLLPPGAPANVRHALARCLERDKGRRYRDIGDVRIDLSMPAAAALETGGRAPSRARVIAVATVVAVLFAAAGLLAGRALLLPARTPESPLHVAIPVDVGWSSRWHPTGAFALSPSGRELAFIGVDPADGADEPVWSIFVRDLETGETRELNGTDHAGKMAYSPDGARIAFAWRDPDGEREEMRVVRSAGGPVLTAVADPDGNRYSLFGPVNWASGSELHVFTEGFGELYRISADGGEPELVVNVARTEGVVWYGGARPLPGGGALLLTCYGLSEVDGPYSQIGRLDLSTGDVKIVLRNAESPMLIGGDRLVFAREKVLCTARFDPKACELTGPVTPLISPILGGASFSISPRGDLVYAMDRSSEAPRRVIAVDRSGKTSEFFPARRDFEMDVLLSPDARRLLLGTSWDEQPPRVHIGEIGSGFLRPLTTEGTVALAPRWLGNERVLFTRFFRPNHAELQVIDPYADATPRSLFPEADGRGEQFAPTVTPDGTMVLFAYDEAGAEGDSARDGIYALELREGAEPMPIIVGPTDEADPMLSPDGKWLAYVSRVSGAAQVMLRPFDQADPAASARARAVSRTGGDDPFWSRDGRELFFMGGGDGGDLLGVTVSTEPTLELSEPRVILRADQLNKLDTWGSRNIDITPDGEQFILIEAPDTEGGPPAHVHLILNWVDTLPDE